MPVPPLRRGMRAVRWQAPRKGVQCRAPCVGAVQHRWRHRQPHGFQAGDGLRVSARGLQVRKSTPLRARLQPRRGRYPRQRWQNPKSARRRVQLRIARGCAGVGSDASLHRVPFACSMQRLFHRQQCAGQPLLKAPQIFQAPRAKFTVERLAAQCNEAVQRLVRHADHARPGPGGDVWGHQRPGGKVIHFGGHGLAQGPFRRWKRSATVCSMGMPASRRRFASAITPRSSAVKSFLRPLAHGDEGAAVRELGNLPGGQPAAARSLGKRQALARVGRVGLVDGVEQFPAPPVPRARTPSAA